MTTTQIPYTLRDYIDVLRRRWIYLGTLLPAGILIAVYIAFTLPPIYRSSATVMLELSSIPEELVQTTVVAYADQQLELVRRRIMTTENLSELISEIDPYPGRTDLTDSAKAQLISLDTITERVDPVTLEPLAESNAFSIHYHNPDPEIAAEVAERLADMFLEYSRSTRQQAASDLHAFLKQQSEEVSAQILEHERRLAAFKERYGEALPEAQVRNEANLERLERELDALRRQILVATERRNLLELQLSQINPVLFDPDGDWRLELENMRQELAVAQQKYTPEHPTVRRLRRAIQALSQRTDTNSNEPMRSDNPEYIAVQNQLDTVRNELDVLEATAARAREQIAAYERSLQMTPEVEREYRQIMRDYEVAQQRFNQIEASLSEAALGQVLESEQRGDRLTLIRQPFTPSSPAEPNRVGIILIGFVLGAGLAVALAALAESSDPTLRSPRDLSEITDIKPLVAVPFIPNRADRRKRAALWSGGVAVAAVAVAIVASTVMQAL